MEIALRRVAMRKRFLEKLYERASGLTAVSVASDEIGNEVSLASDDLADVLAFLAEEQLIGGTVGLRVISLTHDGKKAVEEAVTPDRLSDAVSVIRTGDIYAGSVQLAGPGSTQEIAQRIDLKEVRDWVNEVRGVDLDLPDEQRQELEADLDTITVQLNSPRPKHRVIHEALRSIRSLLEGVAGNVAAQALLHYLGALGVR